MQSSISIIRISITAVIALGIYLNPIEGIAKNEVSCEGMCKCLRPDNSQLLTSEHSILKSFFVEKNIDDVDGDVNRHLAVGDFRVFLLNYESLYIPWVLDRENTSNDWLELCKVLGVKKLNGTSHSFESMEHLDLMTVATKYASEYNRLIIEKFYSGEVQRVHNELKKSK